jgi:hypothetical protein
MDIDFYKWRKNIGLIFVVVLCFIIFFKIFPMGKSPKSIVKRFYKARNSGNTELLKKIIYFPPETTEEQKQAKVESMLAGSEEKLILRSMGLRLTVKYQKYIDDDTAEVGTMGSSIFLPWKRYPVEQIILKKQDGIWKYYSNMANLPKGVLIKNLKNNPQNADLYFHLGRAYLDENLAKSHRLYLRYYELAPEGFWIDEDFLRRLKEYSKEFDDPMAYEKKLLDEIENIPISGAATKAVRFKRLGQFSMELKDYQKAKLYLEKSEAMFKLDPRPSGIAGSTELKHKFQGIERCLFCFMVL